MTTNIGKFDRGIRVAIATLLLFVAMGTLVFGSGILLWLVLAVAVIFLLTAFVGMCPLYRIIGLKTCRDC